MLIAKLLRDSHCSNRTVFCRSCFKGNVKRSSIRVSISSVCENVLRASGPFCEVARGGERTAQREATRECRETMVREHPMQMGEFCKSVYPAQPVTRRRPCVNGGPPGAGISWNDLEECSFLLGRTHITPRCDGAVYRNAVFSLYRHERSHCNNLSTVVNSCQQSSTISVKEARSLQICESCRRHFQPSRV